MSNAASQELPIILAAFLASSVEFIEALTVVLAVGAGRGWRYALAGSSAACLVLVGLVVLIGPSLILLPLGPLQLAVGVLLLLFGLRWLRKAILRAAGVLSLRDETAAYAAERKRFGSSRARDGWDAAAFAAAFQITLVEGLEVVFIVVAIGAGRTDLLVSAILGAGAALFTVVGLGTALRRPLTRVPENTLKFTVGVLLCAFGTFWIGEGTHLAWPGGDWSLFGLGIGFLTIALVAVPLCRMRCRSARRSLGAVH